MPFKRVAVDLVGPITPASDLGHRYIFTLVDYATRYPETVALKSIDTETVAEALVDIYSRLGIPKEVLSDLGPQFVSECMREVARLLSIKQINTRTADLEQETLIITRIKFNAECECGTIRRHSLLHSLELICLLYRVIQKSP